MVRSIGLDYSQFISVSQIYDKMALSEKPTNAVTERKYGHIIITLENSLVPPEKIECTPSAQDGLDSATEMELRILGCELIQTAGILLKLPQVAMATGQVLFQRFYYAKSFVKHNMEHYAMGCLNLASKIEEAPRRVRDVINVFHHIKQIRGSKPISPLILDQNYVNLKNQVIKAERRVLKELGFCVHVKHPHKMIVTYLQVLKSERNAKLIQTAWNYMNDSLRTDVFVRYSPETIACACIYLAARQLKVVLPSRPPWFSLFTPVEEKDIQEICLTLLRLYARSKASWDDLEKKVNDLRKLQVEAKLKAKEGAPTIGTPNATSEGFSPGSRTASPHVEEEKDKDVHNGHKEANSHHKNGKKKRAHSPVKYKSRASDSRSPSPKRNKHKVLPRGYQEFPKSHKHADRTYSHSHDRDKDSKRHSQKHKRSRTRSYSGSPDERVHKKSYKDKASHRRSRSRSGEGRRHKNRERYRR
ncbi:PREDICTED: cyclin-L1-like [Priapulus caudatus]|uniref:Cyclin-L1-like n=1 Tax=Priapulus caudatus TaxID=37621 RepID=A0ABM1E3Y8_PRICU|nr:PREDICTED: cyclin-L1-like [Priapulus caudatus]XP_014666919.1 PREDICTED: cyclin-L1-like [Priapulus caudatus]